MSSPDDDLPLPPYPQLIHRDKAAEWLREISKGARAGHNAWAADAAEWLATELDVDAAAVEYHQLQLRHHFEGTTYVPH